MIRRCVVCGKKLKIKLNKDRTYSGGYYFSGFSEGFSKKKGKNIEYWECKTCFNE